MEWALSYCQLGKTLDGVVWMEDLNWHCQMTVLDGPSPDRTTEGARLNKHVVIAIAIDNPRTNQKSFSKLKWAGVHGRTDILRPGLGDTRNNGPGILKNNKSIAIK